MIERIRLILLLVIVAAGVGLIGFGMLTGTEGTYWIGVEEQVSQDELDDSEEVMEYDFLEPPIQDAFRKSIETDKNVRITQPPEEFRSGYIHYRGTFYLTGIAIGDAGQHTQAFSMAAGFLLLLAGGIGWYITNRRRDD